MDFIEAKEDRKAARIAAAAELKAWQEEQGPHAPWGSTKRYFRTITITEKIDGTNGLIRVGEDGSILVGSRKQWIRPGNDNHGFAAWVHDNAEDVVLLGTGDHYGEWAGGSIQRRYGEHAPTKRFALFNVGRWHSPGEDAREVGTEHKAKQTVVCPPCMETVPVIYRGPHSQGNIQKALDLLETEHGSWFAPGSFKAEGIIVYLEAARTGYKITLGGDGHKNA
jgi:hypothetical protein